VRIAAWLVASLFLVPSGLSAQIPSPPRREVSVRCARGQTIGGVLARLDKGQPNVLRVFGTCRESVQVTGFDDLRIVAAPGAVLESVPGDSAYPISVSASRAVSVERLTVRVTDNPWKPAFFFWTCEECRLTDVTVDGGTAFWAFAWSQVSALRLNLSGAVGSGIALANAKLDMDDSTFDGGGSGVCGLQVAENAVAVVRNSTFRRFYYGVCAASGGQAHFWNANVIEDNLCDGIQVKNAGHVEVHQSTVQNNGATCWGSGIKVDLASRLFIDSTQVRGNKGGGIVLDHQSFAGLGGGTMVTGNETGGLRVKNGSRAVAPSNPSDTVQLSGNTVGFDLFCDTTSHVNNTAQITGATSTSCVNAHAGDGP
jgi:hypothetical protein